MTPTLSLRGCLTTVKVLENSQNPLADVLFSVEENKKVGQPRLRQSTSRESKGIDFRSMNSSSGLDKYRAAAVKKPKNGTLSELKMPKCPLVPPKDISRVMMNKVPK